MRLTGVATGVSSAADAATQIVISTGRMLVPVSAAAARPIGITISAVAVLLISRPYGPIPPTTLIRPSATWSAAPLSNIAVDSGSIAATRTTVVHVIERYACSIELTRRTIRAPAASGPATAGGTRPVTSSATI